MHLKKEEKQEKRIKRYLQNLWGLILFDSSRRLIIFSFKSTNWGQQKELYEKHTLWYLILHFFVTIPDPTLNECLTPAPQESNANAVIQCIPITERVIQF